MSLGGVASLRCRGNFLPLRPTRGGRPGGPVPVLRRPLVAPSLGSVLADGKITRLEALTLALSMAVAFGA